MAVAVSCAAWVLAAAWTAWLEEPFEHPDRRIRERIINGNKYFILSIILQDTFQRNE